MASTSTAAITPLIVSSPGIVQEFLESNDVTALGLMGQEGLPRLFHSPLFLLFLIHPQAAFLAMVRFTNLGFESVMLNIC